MGDTEGEAAGGAVAGDAAAAEDGVVVAEPTAPPTRSRLGTALRWGGIAAGVVGIVLAVLGVLAFSGASSDDDDAQAVDRRTRELAAAEREADGNSKAVLADGRELGDQIEKLQDSSVALAEAQNEFVGAMNAATDLYNNGRLSDARAAYEAQAAAVADLEQRLADVQAQLAAAHERLADMAAGGGS
jgi:small-conductance mechanosensitive channel